MTELPSGETERDPEVPPTDPASSDIDLPKGRSMQPDESTHISCSRPTRFIVVAGAADSGKTTLLASLHERFLRGPWGGYVFAGCETLLGFERICHPGRGVSGRKVPDTHRTKRSQGRQLLHLKLRVEDFSRPAQDVLLTDLSGEEFDDARDSAEATRELTFVRAAHRLLLLVDGEKIADVKLRQQARDESSILLRALVEEGLLGPTSRVDIIFTKWDIAGAEATETESTLFAEAIRHDIVGRYGSRLAEIRSFSVAARDPTGNLPPAHGLDVALPGWVQDGPESVPRHRDLLIEPENAVEYDRFFRRQLPEFFCEAAL